MDDITGNRPAVTVAVCTYNPDEGLLLRVVDRIVRQMSADLVVELLVIDNNSSPPLADRGLLDGYPLIILAEERPGLTSARAHAVRSAAADVVLFVDDDNVLELDYLDVVAGAFAADDRLGLLGGCIVAEYTVPPPKWALEFQERLAIRPRAPDTYIETTGLPHTKDWPIGAGFAVRRSLALAHYEECRDGGGIEGRQGDALTAGEDVDLAMYVLSAGGTLVLTGELRLTHVIPPSRLTVDYLSRCYVGGMTSTLALERKWAPRVRQPVFSSLYVPLPKAILYGLATFVLRPFSPSFAIKHRIYREFARIRVATLISPPVRGTRRRRLPV